MEDQKKPDEREADMMLAFRIFDADNKGYIESAELRYIILNMDNKIPRDELNELITIADLDRDREITYQGKHSLLGTFTQTTLRQNRLRPCTQADPCSSALKSLGTSIHFLILFSFQNSLIWWRTTVAFSPENFPRNSDKGLPSART